MRILTLNLHCFAEDNIEENQKLIADTILKEDIDIIFFQEVAQSENLTIMFNDIKKDNYGYIIKTLLEEAGHSYYYHYKIGNLSFNKYDEGLAILSKTKMFHMEHYFISKKVEYSDWSTRVIVSAKTKINNKTLTLTSTHFGWSDGYEVFEDQVDSLLDNLNQKDTNIIAGDFNVKAGSEEYNYFLNKGYIDLFYNGEKEFFNVPTHVNDMDIQVGSSRIDYIMSNKEFKIIERKIIFKDKKVSDHFGVLIEIDFKE
jgi:maltose 6'-phosphate phosphatase